MNGIRTAASEVLEQGRSVVRSAADDLKRQTKAIAFGVGFGLGAAVLVVFAVAFALATIAIALATFLATWLALLIVTLGLFVLTGLLALLAVRQFKKVSGGPKLRATERQRFLGAVGDLQREFAKTAKARAKIPVVTGAAGFVLGGGLRAAARFARRRR